MGSTVIDRSKIAGIAAIGALLAVSGCQSGDGLGALNLGGGGQAQQPVQPQITQEELMAFCPPVSVRAADAIYSSYQGSEGEAANMRYQGAITEVTRSCTRQGGTLNMTIAAAGRVVPGPQGSAGTVTLPIRVTVYQDTQEIHSQVVNHQVSVADNIGATQFIFNYTNFSMPTPATRNVRAVVGFETASR